MDEKQLKTSVWQRVIIVIVAILLLGSTVLTYMFIVMSSSSSQQSSEEKLAQLEAEYTAKGKELNEAAKPLSDQYFKEFNSYTNRIKSYNATTANNEKLKIEDLKVGTGKQLTEGDYDYMAYYVGWCADGTIFDSSFQYADDDTDKETPIALNAPYANPSSMIEGWMQGVIGMKVGGVRQLSIPGELAYGDTRSDVCGQSNAPLKFIVMALETDDTIKQKREEVNQAYRNLYTALLAGN